MLTPDSGINMWREAQPHTQVKIFLSFLKILLLRLLNELLT